MTADDQRLLGQLEAKLTALGEQYEHGRREQREDMARIFARLDTLSTTGCAIGAQNARDIAELKRRPERAIGIGAAAASIAAAISAIIAAIFGR